jgi:hypothetical protein
MQAMRCRSPVRAAQGIRQDAASTPESGGKMSTPCYVYVLINPGSKKPIYIGISQNPWERFYQHLHDPCSSVWRALRIMFDGRGRGLFHRDEVLKIYKCCPDRQSALDLEYKLINSTPNILNKARYHQRCWS